MRRILLAAALAAGALLIAPGDAKAQFGRVHAAPVYGGGWSVGFGYANPGFGYGYQPSWYGGYPGYGRGHFDVHPGHFHGFRYIPPHIDYHHRSHSHAVDPFTGQISPFRHRDRHH